MSLPVDPYTGRAVELTPEQAQAREPAFAAAHPREAALNRYYNPFHSKQAPGYGMGQSIGGALRSSNALGTVLNKGPAAGALLGAGVGGVGGLAIGAIKDRLNGGEGSAARTGLVLAALGALLGGYSGSIRAKQAGWRSSWLQSSQDPKTEIIDALSQSQMDFSQKAQLMAAIPKLSNAQLERLSAQIGGVGGAAVGAIIARFLMGAGLLGTAFGAAVGGWLGSSLFRHGKRDALGYPSY